VTGLKIKGQDVPDFSSDKTAYEMELNEAITADDIEVVIDGKAAHAMKDVKVVDDHYACTVTAIGSDMSDLTGYVVNVKSSATGIHSLQSTTNQPAAYFTLDGRQVKTLKPGRIYISRQADGTVTKILR